MTPTAADWEKAHQVRKRLHEIQGGFSPNDLTQEVALAVAAGRAAGLEEAAEIAGTFIARDLAQFNLGAQNPMWTTALVEACGPVLRQVAAAIRRAREGA